MEKFQHYVITRFNLQLYWNGSHVYNKDRQDKSVRTEEWLASRFRLFEKYCLPSVMNQQDQNFVWLCLFDAATPEGFRGLIHRYEDTYANFRPCYLNQGQMKDICLYLKNYILAESNTAAEFIITTRLDNDDALHTHMIAHLHTIFDKGLEEVIYSNCSGAQYIEKHSVVKFCYHRANHFLTRIEKRSDAIKTIMEFNHAYAYQSVKQIDIHTKNPMWLEVIHERNAANDVRFQKAIKSLYQDFLLISKYADLSAFGVNKKLSKVRLFSYLYILYVISVKFLYRHIFKM